MRAEKLLRSAAVLGAIALCNCTALFDGDFPTDADVGPNLTTDGAAPSDTIDAADSTVEERVANDAAEQGALSDAATVDGAQGEFGAIDATQEAPGCTRDLSNIGTNDFDISFKVTSVQDGLVALVNQRASCGPSAFWDVRMSSGFIFAEVDSILDYNTVTSTGTRVNDGLAHRVSVRRSAETLTVYVDGLASGSTSASESLGQLAPVVMDTDVCVGVGVNATVVFVGTLANLCITSP
jgi:hypothetical protein